MPEYAPLRLSERMHAVKHRLGYERALRKWIRQRRREIPLELASPLYSSVADAPKLHSSVTGALSARHGVGEIGRDLGRPAHVVVVPQEGYAFDSFRAGTRNFYYEAWRNLAENLGESSVSIFNVDPGEDAATWHVRLLHYVKDVGATHIITHIEADPGSQGATWTWDTAWGLLLDKWDGVLLGVMFDSSYEWIAAKSRLLARMSSRFMVVDICIPMDGSMARGRHEVGPVNMPVSRESLALVDARLADVAIEYDVSFIGVMYPYRMELVSALRAQGVSVVVNPHRTDVAEDDVTSRRDQPSWLDYMAGLRSSKMTLNFSQSSAGPFEQLKTRVIEATLAGTLLLTDDVDRTSRFWVPEEEFGYFGSVDTVGSVVESYLADPERLARVSAAGELRARQLAHTHFWDGIEAGLTVRGLPGIAAGSGEISRGAH